MSVIRGRLRALAAAALAMCLGPLAAACSSGSGGYGASGQSFTTTAQWGPSSWTYSPFSANIGSYFSAFGVQLPLGFNEETSDQSEMFSTIPQLMTSLSVSKDNVATVHLVPGAKFSDGEPVDAADVIDTILLRLVQQNFQYESQIESWTSPNPTTLVIRFTPATATVNVRGLITNLIPQPVSQYKQFLPAGIEPTLLAYSKLLQNPKTVPTAQSSPEFAKIEPLTKKLLSYSPKTLLGDGPFMVSGANTSTITEVKSPTFFGASKVHVDKITLLNTVSSESSVYAQLFGHNLDWYGDATPSATELRQLKTISGLHVTTAPRDQIEDLLINNQSYPFTLTPVRQALAYLINRQSLTQTEDGGTLTANRPSGTPDGFGSVLDGIWLTPSERARLNPYSYNPAKAAALLTGAGFKKSGGKWLMPNGKPFTTQVIAPSAPTTAVLAAQDIAAQLTQFGIPASASTVPGAGYQSQYQRGDFQLAWQYGVDGNLEPICGAATSGLGSPINYTYGTNNKDIPGQPGIGFGASYNVPGLGKVAVSQTVNTECQDTAPGPQMAAYTWDWAQVVNKEVPFLDYADDETVNIYSTARFTDWPPASSPLWRYAGLASPNPWEPALVMMMEDGYLRPAS